MAIARTDIPASTEVDQVWHEVSGFNTLDVAAWDSMSSAEIATLECAVLFRPDFQSQNSVSYVSLEIEKPTESVKDETIDYNVDHAYLLDKENYENFIVNDSFVRNGGFEHSSDSLYWDIANWAVSQGNVSWLEH